MLISLRVWAWGNCVKWHGTVFKTLHKAVNWLCRFRCTVWIRFLEIQVLFAYKTATMFSPNTHQLNFSPRDDNQSMFNSLQLNEPPSFFTDNLMITPNGSCFTDGSTFAGHPTSGSDFAKGIYNLRPRGSAGSALPVAPAKFEHEEAPQPSKPKRQRNSLKKRLLVNARERDRMRVLNNGFQALRDALPCYIADGHMAKITTLRLAINYIKALNEVLNEDAPVGTPVAQCTTPIQQIPSSNVSCNAVMIQTITSQPEQFKQPLPPIDVSSTLSFSTLSLDLSFVINFPWNARTKSETN